MKNRYRIVQDYFLGYEAQVKFWWFPFIWFEMHERGFCNTHKTIKEANDFVESKRNPKIIYL